MARVLPKPGPSQARSLFLGGAALLALYLFALRELSGVTNAVLLGFAGVVVAVVLDIPTARLAKRMPRPLALILVLLVLAGALFQAARWLLPALARQVGVLGAQLPRGVDRLWSALRRSPAVARALPEQLDLTRLSAAAFGHALPFLSGALSVVAGLGIVVTIGAFLCSDPEGDLRTLDALVHPRHHERLHELAHRSAALLRRWIKGSLVTMAIVGLLTAFGLWPVGIHGWLALGLFAAVGVVVPYLGSVVVGAAIFAAGLADSPRRAFLALGVYAVVQVLQGTVIAPLISRATIRASPALLLLFQCVMAASFGVLGVLLAQPMLAVVTVILESANQERPASTPV
jgi:predicted PurR-regulated permease PerM